MLKTFVNRPRDVFIPIILILIFIVGFFVRSSGAKFGLPDLLHPDEARIVLDSMSMGQRMSPIPEDINYPLFHKYFLLVSYGIYFVFGLVFGFFKDKTDFAVRFLQDPSTVIYISRIVTSIMGTLTIVVAYHWGKFVNKSKVAGLVAAIFVVLEWQLVFESQYAVHQTLSGLSSLLAFLGMSMMCINQERKSYIIGGLTIGFAVASHQTTILLFPAILFLFITDLTRYKVNKSIVFKNWMLYSLFALLIGTMGNLNWIFRFERSLSFFLQGSGAGKVAFSSAPFFSYNIPSIMYWYFTELLKRDYFIGLMVLYSAVVAIVRRKKLDVLYIIVLLTYFVFFYKWTYRWMHLFVGLIPISMMFASREYFRIAKKVGFNGVVLFLFTALLVVPNLWNIVKADQLKQLPETRQVAREWILKYIPENTKIAIDYPAYSVSLPTAYPLMLRNRIARNYFDTQVPPDVRNEFLSLMNGVKKYDLVDMIDSRTEPVWPKDMPREAIERASKSTTMRDIYAYFNFKPIRQLKDEGVKYIVINSYTYGMALTIDDPRKTFLMNYYLKDDVIPFAYNTGSVHVSTQHELLFYMVRRERDYFLQLLNNEIDGISLIQEFYPQNNLGPVVKIYKVN